jgi:dihydrodipicolinate synthase/N-acetylneuraminate lyase
MNDSSLTLAERVVRGVYPVLVSPFDESGDLDVRSLERCVEFCLTSGADGIVGLVNASEFTTLSDAERREIATAVIATVAHQVPVVLGVTAGTARLAAAYAAEAHAAGADAVIAMPPLLRTASRSQVREYYQAIAATSGLPVFIQSYHAFPATQLSVDLIADLVRTIDGVEFVKEETLPAGQRMTELLECAGPSLRGVMGGFAGRFMIDEFLRGACGTMPACEIVDVHVAIWRALEAGDVNRARAIHARALPLLNLEWLYGPAVYKEVLRRRGIIDCATVREPGAGTLDARDSEEIDAVLDLLRDDLDGALSPAALYPGLGASL